MGENKKVAARFDRRVTRRRALRGVGGALAATIVSRCPTTARADGPGLFASARHQFTLLRPVRIVPPVLLTRIDGAVVDFSSLRGKVVLVNFWATWCPACRSELPALERLQAAMGGADFEVVAISVDRDGAAIVAPFLKRLGIRRLPVYLDAAGRTWSKDGSDGAPFTLYGMPISYLINPEGRIEGYLAGDADWLSDDARSLIESYSRMPTR